MRTKSADSKAVDTPRSASEKSAVPPGHATRETVESIVVAFILAFFFRTFEAEAFVIPTGSMAPTLQGLHKDVYCPECGTSYRAGASSENPDEQALGEVVVHRRDGKAVRQLVAQPANKVTVCVCPQCGFRRTDADQETSYSGDRILVSKFAYDIADPQRWDVIVFRYPGDAKINYIKRLIGLPNESLLIERGDIFTRPLGDQGGHRIARKPPHKLLAMLQPVDDNHYIPARLDDAGWPRNWQLLSDADAVAWKERVRPIQHGIRIHGSSSTVEARAQSFDADAPAGSTHWLAYRHWRPGHEAWEDLESSPPGAKLAEGLSSGLVTDFYAYNAVNEPAALHQPPPAEERTFAAHWVGDLAVECQVRVHEHRGQFVLELVEAGYRHWCRIDLSTGVATLGIRGPDHVAAYRDPHADQADNALQLWPASPQQMHDPGDKPFTDLAGGSVKNHPTGQTPLKSGGVSSAKILFAQCDDELRLWVDGKLIEFDHATTFGGDQRGDANRNWPTEADRMPARLGVDGAKLAVEHVRLLRDVYYIRTQSGPHRNITMRDSVYFEPFQIGPDEFFALGDNSPASQDSRIWNNNDSRIPNTIERRLLIGKALFIYWPHSLDYFFPFCPNFPDMGFVR